MMSSIGGERIRTKRVTRGAQLERACQEVDSIHLEQSGREVFDGHSTGPPPNANRTRPAKGTVQEREAAEAAALHRSLAQNSKPAKTAVSSAFLQVSCTAIPLHGPIWQPLTGRLALLSQICLRSRNPLCVISHHFSNPLVSRDGAVSGAKMADKPGATRLKWSSDKRIRHIH
ncbi:hypothetical protein SKAU_G00046500 [Synaphobranchus kaupii]|uniref:Uncharacterized protein n=1 Tax=Synaphobranchus kaupii TaxID=118154 RepID=A0A9Q1J9B7_SYNKA|nr:hypothetical protein SKAU_G00046500 [Synaphobranchus kaupii]